ncbi:LytR/AlgR family response regulator transcription factor [Ilyobacter polytropus]|uniref:Two component transcriptional regulator, LytTR family n=1 Tax=Ilyobacter polytropus (strain ATCC 51220 / DSM 2926 / LMG 16218 / CuHBu1) TaxID=572544 RepID=E3HCS5_ILYPC|nr:LytTR family DNA-binding domain-containing protein [Ilyobacter polytropus]ADO84470.1 two component transcriptional regulator, LytTR family [Ilyobacter polytropus DSM 2926]
MIRIFIVDDEKYIRNEIRYFLEKYNDVEICGESGDGDEALEKIEELKPDCVFMDINLQNNSGMLIARKISENKNHPLIVFATAYDHYAVQGFEVNAADYILKPFSEDRIKLTIDRVRDKIINKNLNNGEKDKNTESESNTSLEKLCIQKNNKLVLIDVNKIIFIKSEKNVILVHTLNSAYECSHSLKELETRLREDKFMRIHKSTIINIDYIDEIIPWFNYTYKIEVKGLKDCDIQVSRNYLKKFKNFFGI